MSYVYLHENRSANKKENRCKYLLKIVFQEKKKIYRKEL
jgi:hypothetical protein